MKNTIYYKIKKELKNNTIKIDNKESTEFIKDIDKLSRSILELGINNKDNIVIEKNNSIKFLEIIYAFNKIGLNITIIDNETTNKRNIINESNYLFVKNIDEIVYAGGGNSSNSNYYLNNNATRNWWWALSPFRLDGDNGSAISVWDNGFVGDNIVVDGNDALRPSITLIANSKISSGNGTIENPYTIK